MKSSERNTMTRHADVARNEAAAPTRLPLAWASTLRIKLDWIERVASPTLDKMQRLLRASNDRLSTATDGQWHINRFLIHDKRTELGEEDAGVCHFHRRWRIAHGDEREHGHADGRPNDPSHFHLGIDRFDAPGKPDATSYAGVFVHEILHSWVGLFDEYEDGEPRVRCPRNNSVANATDSCIMWDSSRTKLCRPETHNPNTDQGDEHDMDCYSWLVKAMHEAGHHRFKMPRTQIPGPITAPPLDFLYLTILRVRQRTNIRSDPANFYVQVTMDGKAFKQTEHRHEPDVSPNWFFGLAYMSVRPRSIPITILLRDAANGDAVYDIDPNPRGGGVLRINYDPTIGQFTGDTTGSVGRVTHARGLQGTNRADIWFRIDAG